MNSDSLVYVDNSSGVNDHKVCTQVQIISFFCFVIFVFSLKMRNEIDKHEY